MGKIISIMSNSKKAGKTVFTYLLASKIKESCKDIKILICCLNQKYSGLYKLLEIDPSEIGLEDIVNHKYYEESKQQYLMGVIPQSKGVFFLGSYKTTNSFAKKYTDDYILLFKELKKHFDIILIDTVSGSENVVTKLVNELSDIKMNLLSQDTENLNQFKEYLLKEGQQGYNTINIINQYRNIYPRVNEIRSKYGIQNVHTLYYCETLQEMKNRDSLHLYLQHETKYNNTLTDIYECLSSTLPLPKSNVKTASKYHGVFAEILGGR